MGRYRLGDTIRMTRKSLSITQEQLCEGICSVETLSRLESGRQNPSKDVYELLMERMGRIRDRAYSMLSISDFRMLEKMKLFDDYIRIYDFQQADYVLNEIKKKVGNTVLDRQFLIRAESLVKYRLSKITADQFLDGLQQAILLTIPKYGTISLSNWPLNNNEANLLLNISTAYADKKDIHKAISILEELNDALKQSYMDEQQRAIMTAVNSNNLSKWYTSCGRFNKAIEIAEQGILTCRKYKLGNVLPNLLYNIVWCKEQLIEMGVLSPEESQKCFMYLKQAYYIAAAMQQPFLEQFLEKHIESKYLSKNINMCQLEANHC